MQDVLYPDGEWRNKNGRPKGSKDKTPRKRNKDSKETLILDYACKHPEASQQEIANALKVSRKTVNKWSKKRADLAKRP